MSQLTLFDGSQKFVIDKPIRLIELFGGYGSQALALKYLGVKFEHWKLCEWAVKSIQAYKDIHFAEDNTDYSKDHSDEFILNRLFKWGISANYNEPMTKEQIKRLGSVKQRQIYNNIKATHNLVNISKVKGEDLQIEDTDKYCYIMTYSFPCGLAGTKIITDNGYKNIEDIKENDYVLTHNNRFCKVKKIMHRVSNHYYKLKGLGVPELLLTGEHPLYVLRNGKNQWIKVKDLKTTDMFAFNKNTNAIDNNLSNELLWLLGRYVADGYINKYLYNSIEFAIGNNKEKQFLNNIPYEYLYKLKRYNKSCIEYRIADKNLQNLCKEFGIGALNKKVPQWVIDLPNNKLQSFFDGYISGDGHIRYRKNTKQIMFSTISKELFLGMQQIIIKLYNCVCSCSIRKDSRKSTFSDTYNCQFNLTNKHKDQVFIDNKIYTKVKDIIKYNEEVDVYNFEVDRDNSYTCENVIVHNCQDLSKAGKGAGMEKGSGTRSGLLWEIERILDECNSLNQLPQVLLMENVPDVIGSKNIKHFAKWLEKLESLGYHCYWKVLNAKDFGIPQNRERCFMVSILGDYYYEFPQPIKLEHRLKDLLEENVDEKYYLSDKALLGSINTKFNTSKLENKLPKNGICPTIRARDYKDPKCVAEPKLKELTQNLPQAYRVYDPNGLSVSLVANGGGIGAKTGLYAVKNNLKTQLCNELIASGKVKENDVIRHSYSTSRMNNMYIPNNQFHDCSPTLDTRCDCLGVVVKSNNKRLKSLVNKMDLSQDNQFMDIYNQQTSENAGTITTRVDASNSTAVYTNYRIRKLTPLEVFRLMGVKDKDFEKITQNQSNASLYHLAGDSIVVNVLMAIFGKLFDKE